MPFTFQSLELPGVVLVEAEVFADSRGYFAETYKSSVFSKNGLPSYFVQENYSFSLLGVLRGLHYQKHPQAQGKLVRVLRGEVYDVAVDMRKDSPTFGHWTGVRLSDRRLQMLYIPPGFAHGFCVLSEEAGLIYKTTAEYAPELARGIRWNDSTIGIQWPIAEPILSPHDDKLPRLEEADCNFRFG